MPGPVRAYASTHLFLAEHDLSTVEFSLVEVQDYPGRYHSATRTSSYPVMVDAEASGSLDELEAYYRRHLDLIAAERARRGTATLVPQEAQEPPAGPSEGATTPRTPVGAQTAG